MAVPSRALPSLLACCFHAAEAKAGGDMNSYSWKSQGPYPNGGSLWIQARDRQGALQICLCRCFLFANRVLVSPKRYVCSLWPVNGPASSDIQDHNKGLCCCWHRTELSCAAWTTRFQFKSLISGQKATRMRVVLSKSPTSIS